MMMSHSKTDEGLQYAGLMALMSDRSTPPRIRFSEVWFDRLIDADDDDIAGVGVTLR